MRMAKEKKLTYVNGYDHPYILAGQGTCGLEMLEQVPDMDAAVCLSILAVCFNLDSPDRGFC